MDGRTDQVLTVNVCDKGSYSFSQPSIKPKILDYLYTFVFYNSCMDRGPDRWTDSWRDR
jgi:hypothetical protein